MKNATLSQVWDKQESYNTLIQNNDKKSSSEWLVNYILGANSELAELLQQTNWRNHPIYSTDEFGPNIAEELADVTKYVFSLWQLMGFTEQDMLNAMNLKSDLLSQLLFQETRPPLKRRRIMMLDLDGVVADFRQGFMEWVSGTKWADILTLKEEEIGLHMDINHGWNYRAYNQAKIEFEQDGGYSHLPVIKNVKMAVNVLRQVGWYIMVYTARPYTTYKRIWGDTWTWIKEHDITVDELHFGYDERVVTASQLSEDNMVVALEDDPTLIHRYSGCDIPVFVYPQPYNNFQFGDVKLVTYLDPTSKHWEISDLIFNTTERRHARQREGTRSGIQE